MNTETSPRVRSSAWTRIGVAAAAVPATAVAVFLLSGGANASTPDQSPAPKGIEIQFPGGPLTPVPSKDLVVTTNPDGSTSTTATATAPGFDPNATGGQTYTFSSTATLAGH